jgi:hypothetical protein
MTPDDFAAWRTLMGRKGRPINRSEAARLLGCSRNMPQRWEDGSTPIPLYIELACSALAVGIVPGLIQRRG